MGGSVGSKGTDGQTSLRAAELGGRPVTPQRTREFLSRVRNMERIVLLVAPGRMGEQLVVGSSEVVGASAETTTAEDPKRIAR
jgi:predicted polyphosphate/ATP-dependent NAD kinase